MYYRSTLFSVALLLSVCLLPLPAQAQTQSELNDLSDLRGALKTMGKRYADNYVQPVTDAFGAGVGSGLFRTADVGNGFIPFLPIDAYLGVSVSGPLTSTMKTSFLPEGETITIERSANGQTFETDAEILFDPSGERVPTVFGSTDPEGNPDIVLEYEDPNGNTQREDLGRAPQGLLDTGIAPIIVPQLGVGSVAGTDLQVRYFPKVNLGYGGDSYGKIGLFGLSVRHDIDQWFPTPLPVNIAVQGSWNQFSLESRDQRGGDGKFQEVVSGSGWAFNVHASRGIPIVPVVVYGGVQYEKFGTEYTYSFDPSSLPNTNNREAEPIKLSIEQDASINVRGLAGLSISFPPTPIRLNVDYAVSNASNVVTTGLGVRL